MKTRKLFLLLFLIQIAYLSSAQIVSGKIANAYPPSVVRRMYESVLNKMHLTETSQSWLARSYIVQDSLLVDLLLNHRVDKKSIERIKDSLDITIEVGLKKIMTRIERSDYKFNIEDTRSYGLPVFKDSIVAGANMDSEFGIAYKLKDQIHLTDSQSLKLLTAAVNLRNKEDYYKTHLSAGYFDRSAFEISELVQILDENQINAVLAEKNKKNAQLQAGYDWHEITELNISTSFNKETAIKEISVYYMMRSHIMDRFADEKERRMLLLQGIKLPAPLMALRDKKFGNTKKMEKYAW